MNFKIPKTTKSLKNKLSKLIIGKKNITSNSRNALLKKVFGSDNKRGYNRSKLIDLYESLIETKPTEKITLSNIEKKIKEAKKPIKSFKHGSIVLNADNVYKYTYAVTKFYKKIAKNYVKKYPNSIYKFKFRYYMENGQEVKKFEYGSEIITPWDYTFLNANKSTIQDMVNQTTSSAGTYDWHPLAFLANIDPDGMVVFTAEAYPKINNIDKAMARIQKYRDNDTGTCVYDGCLEYLDIKQEKDTNAKAAYNKLKKSRLQYATEYTDETLCKIGQLIKASIVIKDLVNGNDKIFNKDEFNRYRIEFLNTRYGHLELSTISLNKPVELEDNDELQRIKDKSDYYVEKYGTLYTRFNTYKVKDTEFKIIFKQWQKDVNFNKYSISIDSPSYKFLEEYDFVMHRFFNNMTIDNNLYQEFDLRKAYYNYSDINFNKFYVGVPSGAFIHCHCNDTFDYNKLDKKIVGFFEIQFTKINNDKLLKLGFKIGSNYIFYTSMINLLLQHCEMKFINAIYSPSIHIPFTKEFLMKEDGISHYCKAVGIFQSVNNKIDTNVKILNINKNDYTIINTDGCSYYRDQNIVHISRDNLDVKNHRHIALAIHSYNHTLVLNEMLKINIDDIFGIKLDSIIIKKDVVLQETDQFKIKEANVENLLRNWGMIEEIEQNPCNIVSELNKLENLINSPIEMPEFDTSGLDEGIELNSNISTYDFGSDLEQDIDFKIDMDYIIKPYITPSDNTLVWNDYFLYTNEYVYNPVVIIGGIGGSGKTSSLMRYLPHNETSYTTTCWNLINGVKEKNNDIVGLSIPKLTGVMEGKAVEKCYKPQIKFIVHDEMTLVDYFKESKEIINLNHHCFHFLLGDIDYNGNYYQCSMKNKVINPSKTNYQYVKYTKTFRFDGELNTNLNLLRSKMTEYKGDRIKLCNWFKNHSPFTSRFFNIDDIIYNDNDVGISSNNELGKCSKHLTEKFLAKGTREKYFIKTTYLHKKQYCGAELECKPDHNNYVMTLFKTIHSFQGLELENDNNLIVDLSSTFDYNLLYTAMSRAKRMDQIFIIQ